MNPVRTRRRIALVGLVLAALCIATAVIEDATGLRGAHFIAALVIGVVAFASFSIYLWHTRKDRP